MNKQLKEDGDYYFGNKLKTSDGMLEMAVYYQFGGEKHVYIAVGEDSIDLYRDWAFEWLDIFGDGENGETAELDTTH